MKLDIIIVMYDSDITNVFSFDSEEKALGKFISLCKEAGINYDFDSVKTSEDILKMYVDIREEYPFNKWEFKWFNSKLNEI